MIADPGVKALVLDLHSPDESIRQDAVVGLRDCVSIPEVQHALRCSLNDTGGHIRILAAEALSRNRLFPQDVLPVLIATLEAADEAAVARVQHAKQWRRLAAGAIAHYGPDAEPAIDALRTALLDPEINVRGYAALALGAIGPPAILALQDLRVFRQSQEDHDLRTVIEDAIRKIGVVPNQLTPHKRVLILLQEVFDEQFQTSLHSGV